MNAELQTTLDALVEGLAAELATKGADKIIAEVDARRKAKASDPLLTVREAAEDTGLSESSIRNLVSAGIIPKAKGLAEIRIRKSQLDKYAT